MSKTKIYAINDLANLVPLAGPAEQEALTRDIEKNGQKQSALLWKGEIIDGRCRQKSCIELGRELKVTNLKNPDGSELSLEQAKAEVKSYNTRRNLKTTQVVAVAYKHGLGHGYSNAVVAKDWGCTPRLLTSFKALMKLEPGMFEALHAGKNATIMDYRTGVVVATSMVNKLLKIAVSNRKLKKDTSTIDYSKCIDDVTLRAEFIKLIAGSTGSPELYVKLVELYNYRTSIELEGIFS
jgi:hypothetical protein